MLRYRDFISLYTLIRALSVLMRFTYVFIVGKLLSIEDFNKLSLFNYVFFASSQIAGFGLHYFYLRKLKKGILSLNTYISTISIFSLITLALIGLGIIAMLEKNYWVIILFVIFILTEYVFIEIQRIGQLFDMERVLSLLPFWKNLLVIIFISISYVFFHIDLIILLLALIFSSLTALILILAKKTKNFQIDFNKNLLKKGAFLKGFFYFLAILFTSLQYLGEKIYLENYLSSNNFYYFNLRLIYLLALSNVFESTILIKLYSEIFDGKHVWNSAGLLLLTLAALLGSFVVEFVVLLMAKPNAVFSMDYVVWNFLYFLLFVLNYRLNVRAYAIHIPKHFVILQFFIFVIYIIVAWTLTQLNYVGAGWLVIYQICSFLVLKTVFTHKRREFS